MKAIAVGSGVVLLIALIWAFVNYTELMVLLFIAIGFLQFVHILAGGMSPFGFLFVLLLLIGSDCDCD